MILKSKKAVVILISFILSITTLSGCGKKEEKTSNVNDFIPVEVEEVKPQNLEMARELSGKLRAYEEIPVIPKIPGKADKIYVKVGEEVNKDSLLMTLDGTDVDLQIAQAQAGYDLANSSVNMQKDKLNELNKQKSSIEKGIDSMDSGINSINKNLADLKAKYIAGLIPLDVYSTTQSALEAQRKKLEDERTKLLEAKAGIDNAIKSLPFNSETLNAQLKQAQSGLNMAKGAKNNLKLTAPIKGIVAAISAVEGGMVVQTMPPVTIINISSMLLDVNLTETEVNKVKAGDKVSVYVDAYGEAPVDGIIDFVSPSMDLRTQSYLTRIKISNPTKKLKPGMFAKTKVALETKENVLTVSKNSLVQDGDKYYVFVVNGDKTQKKEVQTGLDNGERVEILSGIGQGERVVFKGQNYLKDGDKIQVVRGEEK